MRKFITPLLLLPALAISGCAGGGAGDRGSQRIVGRNDERRVADDQEFIGCSAAAD